MGSLGVLDRVWEGWSEAVNCSSLEISWSSSWSIVPKPRYVACRVEGYDELIYESSSPHCSMLSDISCSFVPREVNSQSVFPSAQVDRSQRSF